MPRPTRKARTTGLSDLRDRVPARSDTTVSEILRDGRPRPSPRSLDALVETARALDGVRRADLQPGDRIVIDTRNSSYSILVLGDGRFIVTGGWFDREGVSPATVTINGCTFGARAILTGIVAGRGLCLEFGNNVVTTRIRSFRLLRAVDDGVVH